MAIKRYEADFGRGIFKADGPEDHQRMMEVVSLGMKKEWNSPALHSAESALHTPSVPIEVGQGTGPRYMKLYEEFKTLKQGIKQSTLIDYEITVREFEDLNGPIQITEVTDEKMSNFMRHLAEKKNSESTIDKKVSALRALFNFGAKQKLCTGVNPATGRNLLTKAQKRARGHKFYEMDVIKEIFGSKEFHDLKQTMPNFRLVTVAALVSGIRISALASVRSASFRTSVGGHPYLHVQYDKTPAGQRSVPIPKVLFEAMQSYIKEHGSFGYKMRVDGKGASDPVRKDLGTYLKTLDLSAKGLTIHGLRKTINDLMMREDVNLVARYQFMGHSLSDVNFGHYIEGKGAQGQKMTVDEVAVRVLSTQQKLLDLIEFA